MSARAEADEPPATFHYPPLLTQAKLYVVGDIHGRADLLTKVHSAIDRHRQQTDDARSIHEIYLGDYIDRGPNSAQTVELLIERQRHTDCIFVRGNHESMLLRILSPDCEPSDVTNWLKFGGAVTAISYGLNDLPRFADESSLVFAAKLRSAIPESHAEFMHSTVGYAQVESYLFVHAGINPAQPLDQQSFETLSTIRQGFLNSQADFGFIVVHGHTPDVKPEFKRNRINIDTGAYATGKLTCLLIDGDGARLLAP